MELEISSPSWRPVLKGEFAHLPSPLVVGVDIWERNKELIRKRTDIGEHFTRDVIQSIVFIFLPIGERVHVTNPV